MNYVSDEEQSEIISECLSGHTERECNWCQAHHSKPYGRCCFGVRHEYNDDTCDTCVHTSPCASATHGHSQPRTTNRRIIYPNRRPANTSRPTVRAGPVAQQGTLRDYGPQPGEPMLVQQPMQPTPMQLNPEDNLFERFMKVSMWGAGEGFLEMALNFFRKRRPE